MKYLLSFADWILTAIGLCLLAVGVAICAIPYLLLEAACLLCFLWEREKVNESKGVEPGCVYHPSTHRHGGAL